MNLAGYTVLVEKGRWVDEDKLHDPNHWDDILARLTHLIQNPNYPAYIQRHELKRIRRIRLNDLRIYIRLHPAANILTVLAVVGRGEVKRDEKTGELDHGFLAYLRPHNNEFLPDRFIPLEKPIPKIIVPQTTETAPVFWSTTYECVPLTKEEAFHLLEGARPDRGSYAKPHEVDQFCWEVLRRIERADPADKIVIGLPERDRAWEREEIYEVQGNIRKALALFEKRYSITYDDLSQKIVLVPPAKKALYLMGGRGRRMSTRLDFEALGRV